MIELYTWGTPNGRKVSIMLEETGLPYSVHEVNLREDQQNTPAFLEINPNNKIPAIIDPDGPDGKMLALFESGAILIYLAEKAGSDLLPSDPRERAITMQWLMFQMGGVGPILGQAHHFLRNPSEVVPYAQNRFRAETQRLYGVMDDHLENSKYLAGDAYSIADIATYPWITRFEWHQVDLSEFEHVKRWFDELSARPAVVAGMAVPFLN